MMKDETARALLLAARGSRRNEGQSDPPPGTRFGAFSITGPRMGGGGSGDVYPARHRGGDEKFAIKWARPGLPNAEQIFHEERHRGRLLDHPNIVAARDLGTRDGRPYLVFRCLEQRLSDELRRERYASEGKILELMTQLADALTHAHSRGVLHCDLKADNVLFDANYEPCIADFGLARTIEAWGSSGNAVGGTRGWMSPEQVRRDTIGVQSDLFALGVLLYWLLADGRLPFGRGEDFKRRILAEEPEPLPAQGRIVRSTSWDLAAICRKALQKDVDARYQSASDLKSDLERAAAGRFPLHVAPASKGWRALRWASARPFSAAAGLWALALLPCAVLLQGVVLSEVRAARRPLSHFSAAAQARAVVSELYAMSLGVDAMARDPKVRDLVRHPGIVEPAPALAVHALNFDSVNVFDAAGVHHARWPPAPRESEHDVRAVDHFACARRLAEELLARPRSAADSALPVCVARAHRSQIDGKTKLGLASPILIDGRFVGAVEASTMARDRFGAVQMNCGDGDCFTALLGARDRAGPEQPLPGTMSILAQQGVEVGSEQRLPFDIGRLICERVGCVADPIHPFLAPRTQPFEIDPYLDPVTGTRTVAVVAPVGRTGLSVLFATPYSATENWLARVSRASSVYALALLALIAACSLLLSKYPPNPRWPWPATKR